MVLRNKSGTSGLTEVQARALADWWGGTYQRVASPGTSGQVCHGVILSGFDQEKPKSPSPRENVIFSREEAQALEKFRDAVNPGAPDWVG